MVLTPLCPRASAHPHSRGGKVVIPRYPGAGTKRASLRPKTKQYPSRVQEKPDALQAVIPR
jgi:hypothetical protein